MILVRILELKKITKFLGFSRSKENRFSFLRVRFFIRGREFQNLPVNIDSNAIRTNMPYSACRK